MIFDYIIVGQGLAGTSLAWQLIKRGKKLVIIDSGEERTSSKTGAGLANPFTGPKMVKTWKADVLFPYAEMFYRELEDVTGVQFFERRIIYRPFGSVEELNDWHGKGGQDNYKKFICAIRDSNYYGDYVYDPYGGVALYGYVLDMPLFIQSMKNYFLDNGRYLEELFDEKLLEIHSDDKVRYKEMEARKIIFCTGHHITNSRYFGWLPVSGLKGELLSIKMDTKFKTIFNKSGFIIPRGNGIFIAGSTYSRDDVSTDVTDRAKNEICLKLDSLIKLSYKIVGRQTGEYYQAPGGGSPSGASGFVGLQRIGRQGSITGAVFQSSTGWSSRKRQ